MVGSAKLRKREYENYNVRKLITRSDFASLTLTRHPYYGRAWDSLLNNGLKAPSSWGVSFFPRKGPRKGERREIQGALSIQPKIPGILVGTSNGTDHYGLVPPEYSEPALKVVYFDRSGHFGRSDRNVPFLHFDKIVVHSTALLYLVTKTARRCGSVYLGVFALLVWYF